MKSISFPNMFTGTRTNLKQDYDATLQNLKLLIWSEKEELFGDPYYGTSLRKLLFDQNDILLEDILIDDIYSAIKLFMPQITVTRKDIKTRRSDKGELSLEIKAINNVDFTTDLYSIVLLSADA